MKPDQQPAPKLAEVTLNRGLKEIIRIWFSNRLFNLRASKQDKRYSIAVEFIRDSKPGDNVERHALLILFDSQELVNQLRENQLSEMVKANQKAVQEEFNRKICEMCELRETITLVFNSDGSESIKICRSGECHNEAKYLLEAKEKNNE